MHWSLEWLIALQWRLIWLAPNGPTTNAGARNRTFSAFQYPTTSSDFHQDVLCSRVSRCSLVLVIKCLPAAFAVQAREWNFVRRVFWFPTMCEHLTVTSVTSLIVDLVFFVADVDSSAEFPSLRLRLFLQRDGVPRHGDGLQRPRSAVSQIVSLFSTSLSRLLLNYFKS